jgi:hypothetical protein
LSGVMACTDTAVTKSNMITTIFPINFIDAPLLSDSLKAVLLLMITNMKVVWFSLI